MKWIVMLLGGYTLYYLVLIVFDALKNSAPMADDEDTQVIPVDDMLSSSSFRAKKMELPADVRKEYMSEDKEELESYRPRRVTGAIYAQGFEVNGYNQQLMKSGRAVFDGCVYTF